MFMSVHMYVYAKCEYRCACMYMNFHACVYPYMLCMYVMSYVCAYVCVYMHVCTFGSSFEFSFNFLNDIILFSFFQASNMYVFTGYSVLFEYYNNCMVHFQRQEPLYINPHSLPNLIQLIYF